VTAIYSGDSLHDGLTNTITQVVNQAHLTVTANSEIRTLWRQEPSPHRHAERVRQWRYGSRRLGIPHALDDRDHLELDRSLPDHGDRGKPRGYELRFPHAGQWRSDRGDRAEQ